MPISEKIEYIHEPTSLQCGQAVLAMLAGKTVEEIIKTVGTEKETTLKQMFLCLDKYGIKYCREKKAVTLKEDLPPICFLSLETPRCWHWSLYFKGTFYDPEHGVLTEFPKSRRRYYFEVYE